MFVVSAVAITIHEDPLISPPASRKTSDASNIYFFFYFNLFLKQENVVLNFWQGCQHQSRKSMRTGQYTDTKYFFQRFLHSLVQKVSYESIFKQLCKYILFFLFQKFLFTQIPSLTHKLFWPHTCVLSVAVLQTSLLETMRYSPPRVTHSFAKRRGADRRGLLVLILSLRLEHHKQDSIALSVFVFILVGEDSRKQKCFQSNPIQLCLNKMLKNRSSFS